MAGCVSGAQYIASGADRIFTLAFQPEGHARAQVVYVPPFAEEMNRCRALVSAQARQFAASGIGCTIFDFQGTGDSEGEFESARLDAWMANLADVVTHVRSRYQQAPVLWGMRLGALLAWRHASQDPDSVSELLLLQPVTSGARFVKQLVRQRIAAGVSSAGGQDTSEGIHAAWQAGSAVEIGGYRPGSDLMLSLEAAELLDTTVPSHLPVRWLEHVAEEGKEPGIATQKVLASLRESGVDVRLQAFTGPAVWTLNKRGETPELLQLLSELYQK